MRRCAYQPRRFLDESRVAPKFFGATTNEIDLTKGLYWFWLERKTWSARTKHTETLSIKSCEEF